MCPKILDIDYGMVKKFYLKSLVMKLKLESLQHQADGAVWFQQGGTVVLSTVVTASPKEFPGFLPLTVDYQRAIFCGR